MTTVGRLRGRRTFAAISQQGRTVRSGPLRVRFLAAPVDGLPVEGVAVGYAVGKIVGNAVTRNRIRRRIRAAVAATTVSSTTGPLTSGFYLISADVAAATVPFTELVAALGAAVEKHR